MVLRNLPCKSVWHVYVGFVVVMFLNWFFIIFPNYHFLPIYTKKGEWEKTSLIQFSDVTQQVSARVNKSRNQVMWLLNQASYCCMLLLLLLLLRHFSRVRLCVTPETAAHQALIPGILQARTLEWVAISFSNAWKWKVKVKLLSRVQLLATPWTAAFQAPPSMGFSRQQYWSGVPLPSPSLAQIWTSTSCISRGLSKVKEAEKILATNIFWALVLSLYFL